MNPGHLSGLNICSPTRVDLEKQARFPPRPKQSGHARSF